MTEYMKFPVLLPLMLLASLSLGAQGYVESVPDAQPLVSIRPDKTVLLYPKGQAAGEGIVEDGVIVTFGPQEDNALRGPETCSATGSRRNVGDDARIDLYFPEHCNGQMVMITPGGGYEHLSTYNEGVYGAKWLTERGIAACVLKYRMPNKHTTVPLDDLQNAMRYLRYHAKEWGIRQIGVMGGSAGGHLSSSASTMYVDRITRPDFAVLLYPRISLYKGESTSTKNCLIGRDEEWADRPEEHAALLKKYSPDTHISSNTPPTLIVLSVDDDSVNPRNYLPYYTRLTECGVPVEVHIFPKGGHGWGQSSEDIVGKGKDKFAKYRPEFDIILDRWLSEQLEKATDSAK